MKKKIALLLLFSTFYFGCNKDNEQLTNGIIYHDKEDNNFTVGGSTKWTVSEITYSFGSSFPNKDNFKNAVRNAFQTWDNSSSNIKFKEITGKADIMIEMGGSSHIDCPEDFDDNILAHGFYPPPDPAYGDFAGDLHFHNKWNWSTDGSTEYDLETSALHEIGHILGLSHSGKETAVMFRRFSGKRVNLSQDDIDGICSIYGCPTVNNNTYSISLAGDLNFGNLAISTTQTKTLTISNTGNQPINITGLTLPNGFSGNYTGTLNAGGSTNVTITFSPTQAISYNGTIQVNSNATTGNTTIQVSGLGTTTGGGGGTGGNLPPMIGFWDFENNINDKSGYNNNLNLNGLNNFSTNGINGSCFYFTENPPIGRASSLSTTMSLPQQYSISMWIKPQPQGTYFANASSEYLQLINGDGASVILTREPVLSDASFWYVRFSDAEVVQTGNAFCTASSSINNETNWRHMVLVVDVLNKVIKTYIDGSLKSTENVTCNLFVNNQMLLLRPLHAYIDQVRIFNTTLNSVQIQDIYNKKQ